MTVGLGGEEWEINSVDVPLERVVRGAILIERSHQQAKVLQFLLPTYVGSIVATFALLLLEGFGLMSLPDSFLSWLGPAVVGEFVTSTGAILIALFKSE